MSSIGGAGPPPHATDIDLGVLGQGVLHRCQRLSATATKVRRPDGWDAFPSDSLGMSESWTLSRSCGRSLSEVGTLFTPDTIFRWHRQLIANKSDPSNKRNKPPRRPRFRQGIVDLHSAVCKKFPVVSLCHVLKEQAFVSSTIDCSVRRLGQRLEDGIGCRKC